MKKLTFIMILVAAGSVITLQSFKSNTANEKKALRASQKVANNLMLNKEIDLTKVANLNTGENLANGVSYKNLQEAFKGETTASAKYAAYSKKAEEEGYHEIALLFKAASTSENIHANNHKSVLKGGGQKVPAITPEFTVKSTLENLKDAIAGESYEVSTMYPEYMKKANQEGNQMALLSFNYAYKTEQKHKKFYEQALAALEAKNVKSLPSVYYVCPTCGNTYESTAPERCGISMTSSDRFIKITTLN